MPTKPGRSCVQREAVSLVNKQNIRKFLLEYAERSRSHKFARVGAEVYDQMEAAVREHCRKLVDRQPSKGKTIK